MFNKFKAQNNQQRLLLAKIEQQPLPRHVAVIMDGNGRWAKKRGFPRVAGHREGIKSVREIVETAAQLELDFLTLYAFSAENWQRPPSEVSYLMGLIEEYIFKELRTLVENNIRFQVIGHLEDLAPSIQEKLQEAMARTSVNTGLTLNVALNYGSRTEIVDAIRSICAQAINGQLDTAAITENLVSEHLYTAGQPDPDLLIRTSGELRISNFLLWQLAYAEILVTPVLWPDFRKDHFLEAIIDFQGRERRFGKVLSP